MKTEKKKQYESPELITFRKNPIEIFEGAGPPTEDESSTECGFVGADQ